MGAPLNPFYSECENLLNDWNRLNSEPYSFLKKLLSRISPELFFLLLALLTSALSIYAKVRIIDVAGRSPSRIEHVRYGYIYELNAAFFFVVCAPAFIFVARNFLERVRFFVVSAAHRGLFSTRMENDKTTSIGPNDVLRFVADRNQKYFRLSYFFVLFLVVGLVIVGNEFWPERGDFYKLPFGYVQGPLLLNYPKGVNFDQFEDSTGREVKEFGTLTQSSDTIKAPKRSDLRIEDIDGGPSTPGELKVFWIFLVLALFIQVFFLTYGMWIFLKIAFVFTLVLGMISPSSKTSCWLKLDFLDKQKSYGLAELMRSYNYLIALVLLGSVGMATSTFSRLSKGINVVFSSTSGGTFVQFVGQYTLSLAPILVFVFLLIYLWRLQSRTDDLRDDFNLGLDTRIGQADDIERMKLNEERQLVSEQSAWPKLPFKAVFTSVVPAYILPTQLLVKNADAISSVSAAWDFILKMFSGN